MGTDPHSQVKTSDDHSPIVEPPKYPNEPLRLEIDYSKFDDRFNNRPFKIGPEWSDIDEERQKYINQFARSWELPLEIPSAIPGLEPIKRRKTPSTRIWYKRVSSWERNGFFNVWTIKLNVKLRYWLFYPVVLWGMTTHVNQGLYQETFDHNFDKDIRVYDKLAVRPLPFFRVWARPG